VIISLIAYFFDTFLSFTVVECAFRGIQAGVIYIIISAGIKMLKGIKKTALNIAILVTVVSLMVVFSLFSVEFSTIYFILISGFIGLAIYFASKMRRER
jgi:chromate transporter